MRLFIAVEAPKELKEFFVKLQKQVDKGAKINLTKEFHLTLKFLGEIDEKKLKEVKAKLKEIKHEPFKIKTSNLGVFPTESYIKVVWMGLKPYDRINELQKKIDEQLKDMFPEDKRFHPHITLGRVKFVEDKKKFIDNLKSIKVEEKEFEVKDFRLKKSTLTPEGPVYEDLEIYEF
ncbi:RNA 2',3'-cyclic phosphodiesterase [Candidatus Woesearchaeota archaeon]|nr:RNA 2',3'-cyclic phosphodiesterase [Candidatus Woesearchaeota archaeon]